RTDITKLTGGAQAAILAQFAALEQVARDSLVGQGFSPEEITCNREVDARYSGQGFELRLYLSGLSEDEQRDLPGTLSRVFHTEHARIYGHAAEAEQVEIVSYRIRAVVEMPTYEMTPLSGDAVADEPPRPPRRVYRRGEWIDVTVVRRATLAPGA